MRRFSNFITSQMRKIGFKDIVIVFILVLLGLKLCDVFSFRLTQKWHDFFEYYDGYRIPSSVAAFIPFTAETLEKDTHYKILFTGDSTSGGLLYHHSQAIPAYLNDYLNTNEKAVHVYNLAFSGAHLSEQYLLMKEYINDVDMIVFPIHYSFFIGRGAQGSFISRPEMIDFMTQVDVNDLTPLSLHPRSTFEVNLENALGSLWYTFKTHRLLPYILIGKPPRFWIVDAVKKQIPQTPKETTRAKPIDSMLPYPQQTKEAQLQIIADNELLFSQLQPILPDNTNLLYLEKIITLAKTHKKPLLPYFVPLDLETLTQSSSFNQDIYNQIVNSAKRMLTDAGIAYLDFNETQVCSLQTDDFYNPDHLLPKGNEKIGTCLGKHIHDDF